MKWCNRWRSRLRSLCKIILHGGRLLKRSFSGADDVLAPAFFEDCEVSWVSSSEDLLETDSSPIPRSFPKCSTSFPIKKQAIWGTNFFIPCRPERHETGHLFRAHAQILYNTLVKSSWSEWAEIWEQKISIPCLLREIHFMHHLYGRNWFFLTQIWVTCPQ